MVERLKAKMGQNLQGKGEKGYFAKRLGGEAEVSPALKVPPSLRTQYHNPSYFSHPILFGKILITFLMIVFRYLGKQGSHQHFKRIQHSER